MARKPKPATPVDDIKSHKGRGKQEHQKLKPYVVYQYLLENTDEDHAISADAIAEKIKDEYKIYAERRSIYRDIEEINKICLMLEEDCTIDEAEAMLVEDESLKTVAYKSNKGFYVRQRHFDLEDIRLLAECVYSAKFIAKSKAEHLVNVLCEFVSEYQADSIKYNAYLVDRVKTSNTSVRKNIAVINEAITRSAAHKPEKISFKYLKYTIDDVSSQVERRHGEKYIVSPFQLMINEGNYYLLAYEDKSQKMKTYRVDRMKDVRLTNQPREGTEEFTKIDLKNYAMRHFSMFGGEETCVVIQAINPLLDTMVERFGNEKYQAVYSKVDDRHFKVQVHVEVSDQFFGWLLGFGKRVKLLYPNDTVEQFKAYLDKIRNIY